MSILELQLPDEQIIKKPAASPHFFRAWTSSFLIYFHPRSASRLWLEISPLKACAVAAANCVLGIAWLLLVAVSVDAWSNALLRLGHNFKNEYVAQPVQAFCNLFQTLPAELSASFTKLDPVLKISLALTVLLLLAMTFIITCFLLLPFAARPGRNKPCVKHVLRTVLLGSGFIHVFAPIIFAMFLLAIAWHSQPYFDVILGPLTMVLAVLAFWFFAAMVMAARADYRTPADFPQPHDPTCDTCGYDLIAADPAGRCPECGTPVIASIGASVRPPTSWEVNPSLRHWSAIRHQVASLLKHPRKLFRTMPTLSGQRAAQRWLLMSLMLIAVAASLLVPAINLFLFRDLGFTMDIVWGAIIIGLAWAILALMMVGVETAGIATFSRMKGHAVPLAAAAKVTAYSSPLMLVWVFLGAAQFLIMLYAWDKGFFYHHSIRVQQVFIALSLAVAHIGGLLWYELTVYRGIASIQYANR